MPFKMSSAKWRPFSLGLNVLINRPTTLLNYSKLPRGGGGGDGGVCAGGGGVGIEHGFINLTEYHRDWLDIDHRMSQKSHNAPF